MAEVAHYYPLDVTRRTQITREQFEARQDAARRRWQATMSSATEPVIIVPWGSSSVAHGADSTFETIRAWMAANNAKAIVRRAGPMGTHYLEPQVDIIMPGQPRISYAHITADKVPELLESVLNRGDMRPDLAVCIYGTETWDGAEAGIKGIPAAKELDFWKLQHRIVSRNLGYIDMPEDVLIRPVELDEYEPGEVLILCTGSQGEPLSALVSGDDGLDAIRRIVAEAPLHLRSGGWLLLEHGWDQAAHVREIFEAHHFVAISTERDDSGNERVTMAMRP